MKDQKTIMTVKEIRGTCPVYNIGDKIVIDGFVVRTESLKPICLHALSSCLTLLSGFMHGCSAKKLGIGSKDDLGYLQCPDPGPPLTCGGTVVFELKRE